MRSALAAAKTQLACSGSGDVRREVSNDSQLTSRHLTGRRSLPPVPDAVELSQLCHAVVAPGVEERLAIRISDLNVVDCHTHSDLRCKAYVGPLAAITEGPDGRPDKTKLREVKLEVHNGCAAVEVDVGAPLPQEPWAIRVKFYHRSVSHLFTQEKVAEAVEVVPRPASGIELQPSGSATLEVVRILPRSAVPALKVAAGRVLGRSVELGVDAEDVEDLCVGARELGEDTLLEPAATDALMRAATAGKTAIVQKLLEAGVPSSTAAARAAEQVGTPEAVKLAQDLLQQCELPPDRQLPLLARALEERLPLVAERLLDEDPSRLDQLPELGGESARRAHAAGAWTVLAAMLTRGDNMPFEARSLLDFSLREGHVRLARACLARSQGLEHMEAALRTCLDNGRTEMVREALEAQWKMQSRQWSADGSGPRLLDLECGPSDEPAECGVCFEPLHTGPGVFLNDKGLRACQHFCCLECAEHVQDEAAERMRVWKARRDVRFPQPPGPVCPLCRAVFSTAARFTDPTLDPRGFFRLACVPAQPWDEVQELRLSEKVALGALCAILPVNALSFSPRLEHELWPRWCAEARQGASSAASQEPEEAQDVLSEEQFLRPGGMLAWISQHLLELKVEGQRGRPPRLKENPGKWFRHFDYDGRGVLTKPEVLRGIAKAYDVGLLATPGTPARRTRSAGVQRLREIVDGLWDDVRWRDGVSLAAFQSSGGLAERLLQALPGDPAAAASSSPAASPTGQSIILSVEEALDKARSADLKVREEDEHRAQERAEKQRVADATMPPRARGNRHGRGEPGRPGAELLLASLLEAARQGHPPQQLAPLRIQCPFCGAVNSARAGAGHRVICGGCRSVFAVPGGRP